MQYGTSHTNSWLVIFVWKATYRIYTGSDNRSSFIPFSEILVLLSESSRRLSSGDVACVLLQRSYFTSAKRNVWLCRFCLCFLPTDIRKRFPLSMMRDEKWRKSDKSYGFCRNSCLTLVWPLSFCRLSKAKANKQFFQQSDNFLL